MSDTKMAKLLVEVNWGVIPEVVEGNKRWGFTLEQVNEAQSWMELMQPAYDEFSLRLEPHQNNWVTMTWLWL